MGRTLTEMDLKGYTYTVTVEPTRSTNFLDKTIVYRVIRDLNPEKSSQVFVKVLGILLPGGTVAAIEVANNPIYPWQIKEEDRKKIKSIIISETGIETVEFVPVFTWI